MTFPEHVRAPKKPRSRGLGIVAAVTSTLLLSSLSLVVAAPAQATIGSPIVASTPAGTTTVATTQGKARGSGLWGYAGDVKTRSSGNVFSYGVAISPADGSLWVTDSAKAAYGSLALLLCTSQGGTVYGGICYVGESRVMHYDRVGTDWSVGQYNTNGTYSAPSAGANGGIGAVYENLSSATVVNGSTLPNGKFGGVRGVVVGDDGRAWITDPDAPINPAIASNTGKLVRIFNADTSEGASFGTGPANWADRYAPGKFYYPVGIAQLNSGNFVVSSTTADLLQEFQPDGTWVRNILLDRPANTAYAGDAGYRNPNGLAVDPISGDILVNYVKTGAAGLKQMVERIDATTGALKLTFGVNELPANTDGFTLASDPKTGDVYVAMETGQIYTFKSDGTYLGRFSAFGSGTANGQLSVVRGIAFDANGFMYVTVAQGTANTRVQILARTPDPVTAPRAAYTCAVDGNGQNTGVVNRTAVSLSWTGVAAGVTADGQAPVRDYVVEQSTDSGATWSVVSTPTNTDVTQELTGLNAASSYQFRVSAWNEAGNGDTAVATVSEPTCDLPVAAPGTITVSKTVVDLGTAPAPGTTYSFALTCTVDGAAITLPTADASFVLAADQERTIPVAAGAACVVSEVTAGTFTTAYADSDGSTDGTVDIVSAEDSTVEVTNTYPEPIPGSLTVTKAVTGPAPADASFDFTLECTVGSTAVNLAGDAGFSLTAGGSRTITGIPAGATCAVAEAAVANYTTTFADSDGSTDGSVAITENSASAVTVTNNYTPPVVECVADANSISVVYSTQNNPDAPLDGSYTVADRIGVGRTDMKLVYTIEKPCVTYPVPVLDYTGDWAIDGSDPNTYARFDFAFGAADPQIAADYAVQLAAMNALIATSPSCVDRSIENFEACVRPVIEQWGGSIPVGITGTVTASVKSSTPGTGQLSFHLEQKDTHEKLSIDGTTPYLVTEPRLVLSGAGAFCSAELEGYQDGAHVYTPTHNVSTPFALTATPSETGVYPDDVSAIPLNSSGLTYYVGTQSFATTELVREFLLSQPAGSYEVWAHYVAPDQISAIDPAPVTITVLGAADATCYSETLVPTDPETPSTPVVPTPAPAATAQSLANTGTNGSQVITVAGGIVLLLAAGGTLIVWGNRRRRASGN